MSLPFSFEDRAPHYVAAAGYGATNEEPGLLKTMAKPFNRGLAICSAGEVSFFALLPKTQETLVLVDHSYQSLRAFCTKALLLITLGPTRTKRLLTSEDAKVKQDAIAKVQEHLPSRMAAQAVVYNDNLATETNNIRREWHYADIRTLKKTIANLHKIKLIHGDLLLDTADRGPYDLMYISNALEHMGRTSTYPDVKKLTTLLKPAATVLWVDAQGARYGANAVAAKEWPVTSSMRGFRTSWRYNHSLTPTPAN